jgi:transcription initiation factor TFIID subunit 1
LCCLPIYLQCNLSASNKKPIDPVLRISLTLAEFKPSENIKLFCSGKELCDDISLVVQEVWPNSILHVVRTQVNLWPKTQMLPGEDKPLCPSGAFRKKTDLMGMFF